MTEVLGSLQSMKLFTEVARSGSFSGAARASGMSVASVSRHILALENALGVQLVKRNTRQCHLTEVGESFYSRIERVFEGLQDATETTRRFQAMPQGVLRVHTRVALGVSCIAPALPEFLATHPRMRVNMLLSNEMAVDLVGRNVDVDVRTGLLVEQNLVVRKLANTRRVLVASPAYLQRHGTPRHPGDLAAHNCLIYHVGPGDCVWRFRFPGSEIVDIKPQGNLETDNGPTLLAAALQGVGICHMTDWAVAEAVRDGRLRVVLPEYPVTIDHFEHGIYAVCTEARHGSPRVLAFIDFLAELFASPRFSLPSAARPAAMHF